MLFPQARAAVVLSQTQAKVFEAGFDIAEARRADREAAMREPREPVAEVLDVDADGVPCRIYRPEAARPGLIVHLHGGGFVFNDVDVHDAACRRFANRARRSVISLDYRRPPEHRFPAAPDDVDTALAWLERGADGMALDGPLFAHGDSAGGNLALVAALRHPGLFRALVLIYPFLDPTAQFDSYRTENAAFDPREAAWYWQQYAAGPADLSNPDLAPLLSDRLGTLPPTLVVTSEHDPLRGEGEHLARLLAEQRVRVTATRYLGQLHGFWRHETVFDAAEPLMRQVVGFIEAESD